MQHLSLRHLSISAISQLLLVQFWPNFKCRFPWPLWTYSNCHNDICPGYICPCNICPYKEYLSCYWSNFDQTLKVGSWDHLKHIPTVTEKKNVLPKRNVNTIFFWQKQIFAKKIWQKKFRKKNFAKTNFAKKNLTKFFPKKNLLTKLMKGGAMEGITSCLIPLVV